MVQAYTCTSFAVDTTKDAEKGIADGIQHLFQKLPLTNLFVSSCLRKVQKCVVVMLLKLNLWNCNLKAKA